MPLIAVIRISTISSDVYRKLKIPFTIEQFFNVFKEYNVFVWPIQVVLNILAIFCVLLCFRKSQNSSKSILIILSFFWLWMGIIYHWLFFTTINKAAYVFGGFFTVQGILFFMVSLQHKIIFRFQKNMHSLIASVLILYSLIVYPVIGYFEGHTYPQSPTFGLPCPTTIFTFGMLLLSTNKPPLYIFIIPLVWSVIGSTAALALDVPGDLGLFVSGFLALAATVFSRRSSLQSIEQPQL